MGMSFPGDCEKTPLVFVIVNCPEAFHGRRGNRLWRRAATMNKTALSSVVRD